MTDTARQVRAWREKHNLSLRDAAHRIGIAHSTYLAIERGSKPSVRVAQQLAKAMKFRPWHKLLVP